MYLLTLLSKSVLTKYLKLCWLKIFSIYTLSYEYLWKFSKIFEKAPTRYSGAWGETDSWKKTEVENLMALSLKATAGQWLFFIAIKYGMSCTFMLKFCDARNWKKPKQLGVKWPPIFKTFSHFIDSLCSFGKPLLSLKDQSEESCLLQMQNVSNILKWGKESIWTITFFKNAWVIRVMVHAR